MALALLAIENFCDTVQPDNMPGLLRIYGF